MLAALLFALLGEAPAVRALTADPPRVRLDGPLARQRLLVADDSDRMQADLTDAVSWESTNARVVRVNDRREAVPVGDGAAELVGNWNGRAVRVPVEVAYF